MDSCIVDLTNLTNITVGEDVVLFGKSRSIFDICDKLNLIPYEITAGLSKRIRRILI